MTCGFFFYSVCAALLQSRFFIYLFYFRWILWFCRVKYNGFDCSIWYCRQHYGICLFWLNLLKSDDVVVFLAYTLWQDKRIYSAHLFGSLLVFSFLLLYVWESEQWYFNLVPISLIYIYTHWQRSTHSLKPTKWQTKWHDLSMRDNQTIPFCTMQTIWLN